MRKISSYNVKVDLPLTLLDSHICYKDFKGYCLYLEKKLGDAYLGPESTVFRAKVAQHVKYLASSN